MARKGERNHDARIPDPADEAAEGEEGQGAGQGVHRHEDEREAAQGPG